jgi:hypothetical protein
MLLFVAADLPAAAKVCGLFMPRLFCFVNGLKVNMEAKLLPQIFILLHICRVIYYFMVHLTSSNYLSLSSLTAYLKIHLSVHYDRNVQ